MRKPGRKFDLLVLSHGRQYIADCLLSERHDLPLLKQIKVPIPNGLNRGSHKVLGPRKSKRGRGDEISIFLI